MFLFILERMACVISMSEKRPYVLPITIHIHRVLDTSNIFM